MADNKNIEFNEDMMAKTKAMRDNTVENRALSDDDIDMATGGSDEPNGTPAFNVGDTVYKVGSEESIGASSIVSYFWKGMWWWYNVNFPKVGRTVAIPQEMLHY